MATQVDDPVASHGPPIPPLHKKPEKFCITCGKSDSIDLCSRCKGVWYCNKKCQKADWHCHQLLCDKYAKSNEIEPLDSAYRAFLFPFDSLKPEIVALPTSRYMYYDLNPVRELMRKPEDSAFGPSVDRLGFGFNCRLENKLIGKDSIQVIFRASYKIDGSKANKSLLASVRATGTKYPPNFWAGTIVVRRVTPMGRPKSVTMADLRHALDWLAVYPQHPYYYFPLDHAPAPPLGVERFWRFDDIKGVRITGDQHIEDESERYTVVDVDDSSSVRGLNEDLLGEISPISKLLGRPVRLEMRPVTTKWRDIDPNYRPTCSPAAALMRSLKKDTNVPSPHIAFGLPKGSLYKGTYPLFDEALVISADDKDLSINDVKAMVHFSESTYDKLLQDITLASQEDSTREEAAMQKALDFMTWDNFMLAFDHLGMPRPQRPTEEAFVDMRDTGTPDAPPANPDDEQGTDEEESWDEDESDSDDESDY